MKANSYTVLFFVVLLVLLLSVSTSQESEDEVKDNGQRGEPEETCNASSPLCSLDNGSNHGIINATSTSSIIPESCGLVMAESSINGVGWGIYSLHPRKRGTAIVHGDVVIQLTDVTSQQEQQQQNDYGFLFTHLVEHYGRDAQETGGQFEGNDVVSIVPGIGMIVNAKYQQQNVLPYVPTVDEGGLTRSESPGVGAITHYHNYSWFAFQDLEPGEELFVSPKKEWFVQRNIPMDLHNDDGSSQHPTMTQPQPSIETLHQTGYCLDNIKPRKSRLKHAGRGAAAARNLKVGDIVAPVPVLPIHSSSLDMTWQQNEQGLRTPSQQLLQNYCYGHQNSSILLFPYSPLVNLINHHPTPNVKLQWSKRTLDSSVLDSIDSLLQKNDDTSKLKFASSPLLLELVAIAPIAEGDEIFTHYGKEWEDAWRIHRTSWKPSNLHYAPGYVIDDTAGKIRTEKEQKDYPYPENVQTTCFYRFSDRTEPEKAVQNTKGGPLTTFPWKLTKGLFELQNLRPCSIVQRTEKKKRSFYTVRIHNRPGLPTEELIPKGQIHLINQVPRHAIQFTDVAYTTDQHWKGAFRHEIGLEDDVFPQAWMDLTKDD